MDTASPPDAAAAPALGGGGPGCPAVRPPSLAALFDDFDPPPSTTTRLSPSAAARFLALAKGVPVGEALRLRVELPAGAEGAALAGALRRAFALGAEDEGRALSELFRNGRRTLLIGLATLAVCLTLAVHGAEVVPGLALPKIVSEGLKLIGWVAMWKPMEIFLYEWLPIQRRRRLYERLARAEIAVEPPAANA